MTIKKTLIAALAVAAVAAPGASAAPADSVTLPGAHHIPAPSQDLRSPDQVSGGYLPHAPQRDLRSPDAIDSAVRPPSEVTVVEIPQSAPTASGLDWENVGLGAGAAFGLALLTAGGFMVAGKRRSVAA